MISETADSSELTERPERVQPRASVVVPVRNGGDNLKDLLAALADQTLPRNQFEVLIADDGSTDGATCGLDTADGWVTVSPGPPMTSYAARNRAVRLSRAAVLAFCDVDCRPEPNWLDESLRALEHADLAAGLIRFVTPEPRTIWALLDMDTFLDQRRSVEAGRAVTANLCVNRSVFELVGGFDDVRPNTGDFEFVSRAVAAGARLVFAPRAIVWHPTRHQRGEFLRKVWNVNRHYADRELRASRRPEGTKLRSFVPVIQTLRSRYRTGRSLSLDHSRLAENHVHPTLRERLTAVPLIYILLPYLGATAQCYAWWRWRRAPSSLPRLPHGTPERQASD